MMKVQTRILMISLIVVLVAVVTVTGLCELSAWDCPECGKKGNTRKFCGGCGLPTPTSDEGLSGKTAKKILSVGDIITFGTYPQTSDGTDQTPIEWIVLDVQDEKALLLSQYGLDAKPYNKERTDITWEKCSLRVWLNDYFLNNAFSPKERSAILLTAVDNSTSQGYWKTSGGDNTQDHLFLLSCAEANKYLGVTYGNSYNTKSRVAPTSYAKSQGAWSYENNKTTDGEVAMWWWLRSPGCSQRDAASVYSDGSFIDINVDYVLAVVRPAYWLNLKSDIF